MKKWFHIFILSVMACLGSACSEQTFSNDAEGNFDALWTILDEHYTFFEYKNVDWDAVGKQYRSKITKGINSGELFTLQIAVKSGLGQQDCYSFAIIRIKCLGCNIVY